ncbi:MAG: hypothetical protein R3F40_08065 [Candidatus Competibacteraceae bacterium]
MAFDHLKAQSQRVRGGAVPGERPPIEVSPTEPGDVETAPASAASTAASAASPDAPTAPEAAFFDDWIAQLNALNGLSPAAAQSALRQALQHAPSHRRPSDEDARLFATAGTSTVPYAAVIDWLKIRKAVDVDAGRLPHDTARHWLRGMATVDGDWATRCRTLAHTAARAGHGLPTVLVEVLAAQPPAAVAGYLRCAALKTRLGEAAMRSTPPPPPAAEKDSPPLPAAEKDSPPSAAMAAKPEAPAGPVPPPNAPPWASNPPVSGHPIGGGGVSTTLGQFAGGVLGSAVAGFKTGFKSGFYRVVKRSAAATPSDPAARAEQALADFEAASRPLERHPHLAAFWREVDRLAQRSADGQRSTVFREVNAQPRHPLHALFERQKTADPDVALWHERAHMAFERLQAVWTQTTRASMTDGSGWSPTPAQQDRLRAACLGVPPATDRPVLVECAARLLRDLAFVLRQAFQRPRAGTANPAPST